MRHIARRRTPLAREPAQHNGAPYNTRAIWRKLLRRFPSCREHREALSAARLPARLREMEAANTQAHREEAERLGFELARRGVPAECVAAAVSLFCESALPLVLAGFARHFAEERGALMQRAIAAERRMHAFSVELANEYEIERRRLAQDLHDEIGHDLIVLKLYTQVIGLDLKKGDLAQVRRKLRESVSLIKHALAGVRNLTFDLGPAVWDKQGFVPAVRTYARQFAARTGIDVRFEARRLRVLLPPSYQNTLYMVLQGALSNVAAHANARHVRILMASKPESVLMRVEDDGKGFDVESKMRRPPHSYGLRAMRDRIQILGGSIRFMSQAPRRGARRRGTVVEFEIPLLDPGAS